MENLSQTVLDKINEYSKDIDIKAKVPKIDVVRNAINKHSDWDKTTADFKNKKDQPEILAMLLYEYSVGLEKITGSKVAYKYVIDKLSLLMGKMRFGYWSNKDSNIKYDGMSVTDPKYRKSKGKGFGAQTQEYVEDDKFKKAVIGYSNKDGNGIDLENLNDLRHTFFHEWTHVMELDKVDSNKEKIIKINGRTYKNNKLAENGEIWGNGLVTTEYGKNAEIYAKNKDAQGKKMIMHNQIDEGMVELIARKIMEKTIGKDEANRVIDKERYYPNVRVAESILEVLGNEDTITSFVTNSQKLVTKLEDMHIGDRDALHYISDFVNDQRCEQVIPKYANRTNFFRENLSKIKTIFNIPLEKLSDLQYEFQISENNENSIEKLENLLSKYGTTLKDKADINEFSRINKAYCNLRAFEEKFYTSLSDLLILSKEEQQQSQNNITFQQIGKNTFKSYMENLQRAKKQIDMLEYGVKTQEKVENRRNNVQRGY